MSIEPLTYTNNLKAAYHSVQLTGFSSRVKTSTDKSAVFVHLARSATKFLNTSCIYHFYHSAVNESDISAWNLNNAGSHGFDSRAGQIGHSVATAAMFLRSCVVQALSRGDGSRHLLHASALHRECDEDLINQTSLGD